MHQVEVGVGNLFDPVKRALMVMFTLTLFEEDKVDWVGQNLPESSLR